MDKTVLGDSVLDPHSGSRGPSFGGELTEHVLLGHARFRAVRLEE